MKKPPTWLLDFKSDVYSQSGEDGIIEAILNLLPEHNKWCVEFGAWDGRHLSNTRNLIEARGYSAVLIESDAGKFAELRNNYLHRNNVITLNRFIGFDERDNLDHVLSDTPVPKDFDLLSIDIDGNDYHVWKAMATYKPKVVCIEFNPTIPTEVRFIQPANSSVNQGTSLLSMVELGKEKEYELVSVLPFNAFFVRSEYYPLFEIENNAPQMLRTHLSSITYIFTGFDGHIFLRGNLKLPWHGVRLQESKIQHLPGMLRKYPGNYGKIRKTLLTTYRKFSSWRNLVSKAFRRLAKRND
jgi:hypothetical protein